MTNLEVAEKHFGKIIRNKFLRNVVKYRGNYWLTMRATRTNLEDFINTAFVWSYTPEGIEYWYKKALKGKGVKL